MCSRWVASVAAGTTCRMSHAAANAAPTRPTSRPTRSSMPISMVTPVSRVARGGSVIGTSAVVSSTATTASDASRPTNSAIATDDTIGDAAAIRISASPRGHGSPSGRSTATSAATASGDAISSQATRRASSAGCARQADAAPQSRRTSASARGITSAGTSSGCASSASGGATRPSRTPAAISRVACRPIHARPVPRMKHRTISVRAATISGPLRVALLGLDERLGGGGVGGGRRLKMSGIARAVLPPGALAWRGSVAAPESPTTQRGFPTSP